MSDQPNPVSFDISAYNYRVRFGNVFDPNSITWEHSVIFQDWETAREFIDYWHQVTDYPAVNIKLDYDRDKGNKWRQYNE